MSRLIAVKSLASVTHNIIYTTSGAAPTSPPEGVLRHMRHQERMRAVGTHYGPTRIYEPTGHTIGGTPQLALRSSSTAAIIAGPATPVGPEAGGAVQRYAEQLLPGSVARSPPSGSA